MKISKMDTKIKNAIALGTLCSISYLAVYFARNILGTVTPQMIETGQFNETYIGQLSSIYFIFYAIGQLINGIIGDRIKAKYMLSFGLLLAGAMSFLFCIFPAGSSSAMLAYAMMGFFLSMIYGPMAKVVAENTEPVYAVRCSVGYTFASLFGSPLAGIAAALFVWEGVFYTGSAVLSVMAVICFGFFVYFEKKGIVKYNQYKIESEAKDSSFRAVTGRIGILIKKYRVLLFSLIAALTGIVRTAVVFWLPTYISQYLGYSAQMSATLYTVATLVISTTTFITIFIYEHTGYNMDGTIRLMFSVSTVAFLGVYFISEPILNIVFIVIAIMGCNGASTMLWSKYCPSLRDTGMVSSVTGYLDFISYMAASLATAVFANSVSTIGWGNLILVWAGLMAIGVLGVLPWKRLIKKKPKE